MTASEIIKKYKVPRELEDVVYLAYAEGKIQGMEEIVAIEQKYLAKV